MRLNLFFLVIVVAFPSTANSQPSTKLPIVTADDLAIAPKKYVETAIEIRNARCFFAGPNAYRCTVPNRTQTLSIFAKDVDTEATKNYLETHCGSIKNIDKLFCRFTLRFVPTHFEFDKVSNFQNRTVIRPNFIHAIPLKPSR